MKKTYIAPDVNILNFNTADFLADGREGSLVETSTGGADYALSNKKEQEDNSTSNQIWNNWE